MYKVLIGLITLVFTACTPQPDASVEYDKLIINGKVLDGTGNPWYYADIAVRDDEIVKIGVVKAAARDTIDASGFYVTPGFIDVHSHAASGLTKPELSDAKPLLLQGITTVFVNPDGGGAVDLKEQRQGLLEDGLGVNVAQMVPQGSIRKEVMGMEDRAPSSEELEKMKQLVREGMQSGAFGLSSGPFYAPGSYAKTNELIELSRVAAQLGGAYVSHIRDESNYTIGLEAAVDEVIQVAREAALPGIVTHIKALGPPVWDLSETIVANIEKARAEGVEVFADQYPYMASATGLISALVPRWAEEGGHEELVKRLKDPEKLPKIRTAMEKNLARRGGPDRIQFRYYSPDSTIEGKTLKEIADARDVPPLDMAVELIKKGRPGIVSFNMKEEDVHRFMRQPWTMTSSDGGLVEMGQGVPHPRNYGTFPRKIRKYVLEKEVIDLASAIRSMTTLPAQVFDISGRGQIREGAKADLAIFDLDQLLDKATFQQPHRFSKGMEYVLVNGQYALEEGQISDRRWGRVLNHSDQ
ncbi:N-acyl-D-amino-acid deacylase family protein [Fodinibius salsisoli]|uniref:D-aminoacylase n=1 Tax=Fodinibius salsisoli TaxID=2820877 RepID=A0ABT3PNY7_9BACT|nr:D-aminoacylase [Fodinibius salsisoli]MCW9707578.1 D-aminoacylase [Fodinibius salsisoli]